jgi:solute carrier family 10 (sodium/bile acid cotransporter), member 7
MGAFLLRHWFLVGLALVIAFAALQPWIGAPGGPLWPELTVHLAVAGAFLISGMTLPLARLREAAGQIRLHLFIQLFCFVLVPALVYASRPLLAGLGASEALIQGFVVLACLPITIASCVIFTRAAGGNEAGALCNSVLGNLIGLVVTPALLLLLLDTHGEAPISRVLGQLSLEVLLPLLVGQAIRLLARHRTEVFERVRQVPSVLLLFLIFCVFCATFSTSMPAGAGRDIAIAVLGSAVLHGLLLGLGWWLGGWRLFAFRRGDRIAALLCSTQKTIALGVPMLSILYGHHPQLAWLTLPLICYHPLQLVISGVLAARLRQTA